MLIVLRGTYSGMHNFTQGKTLEKCTFNLRNKC